jgi:hypothetical protein
MITLIFVDGVWRHITHPDAGGLGRGFPFCPTSTKEGIRARRCLLPQARKDRHKHHREGIYAVHALLSKKRESRSRSRSKRGTRYLVLSSKKREPFRISVIKISVRTRKGFHLLEFLGISYPIHRVRYFEKLQRYKRYFEITKILLV